MARSPKIELAIQAKDAASAVLDKVATSVDKLAGRKAEVVAEADDKASKTLDGVGKAVKGLDGEKAEVKASADDQASDELADIRSKLSRLDGEEAELLLKAETKDAKADLYSAQKRLISLDGESAEVEARADVDQAKKRLDAIADEMKKLDSTVAEPKVEAPDAEGAGMNAGSLFSKAAAGAVGAGAIATAVVSAFNEGMDRIKMRATFRDKFGLIERDAKMYGEKAADLYTNGWGDSLEQVNEALGLVQQRLVQTGEVSAAQSDEIATHALAIAGVYEVEVSEVIRSVSQLLLNGLAPDAVAAMDVIISGLQNGGNAAGDFFDTIDEYSQHFAAMGLSAKDMLAIISEGMLQGQRDTDKMADAVKEMRLRTTDEADNISEAYEALGLDADEYRDKVLAGGDSARQAYIDILTALEEVDDASERNRLAIELIGTQYEDLGPNALPILLAITGATEDVTGATQDLTDSQDEATNKGVVIWRKYREAVGDYLGWLADKGDWVLGKILEPTEKIVDLAQKLPGVEGDLSGGIVDGFGKVEKASWDAYDGANAFEERVRAAGEAAVDAGGKASFASYDIDALREAQAAAKEEAKEHAEALRDQAAALDEQRDAMRSAADSTFALHDAEDRLIEVMETANGVIEDGDTDMREARQAMDDAAQAAGAVADAQVRVAQDTAAANGRTLSAADAQSIWNGKMIESARTAKGPLRDGIINYIATVNGIPPEKVSEILADTNYATVAEAQAALDGASRARQAAIDAQAHTAAANAELDRAARTRFATIHVRTTGVSGVNGLVARDVGGVIPGGKSAIVAERRPEIVNGRLISEPMLIDGPASITSGIATQGIIRGVERQVEDRVRQSIFPQSTRSRAGLSGRGDIQTGRGTGVNTTAGAMPAVRRDYEGDERRRKLRMLRHAKPLAEGERSELIEGMEEAFKRAAEAGYLGGGYTGGTSTTYINVGPGYAARDVAKLVRTQQRREGRMFA